MKRTGYAVAAAVTALVVLTILTTAPCISQASGKVHIVVKGDTLWDISSFYMYDPFQWPQIWSANREIENPHLIYPGQEIVIPEMTARVAPPPREARPALPAPPPAEPAAPQPVIQAKPEPEPEPVPVPEEVKQEMILAMSAHGFILDDAEIGIGTITDTDDHRLLISPGMMIYVESDKRALLLTDTRYSIVRVFSKVTHPVTEKEIGYLARVLGDMEVVHLKGKLATAIVGEVYKDIQLGDHVIEHFETWMPKEESDLTGRLTGYTLINPEGKSVLGKGDAVFIDLGVKDGLKTGDTLSLLGKKKTVGGVETSPEVIGEIQVVTPRQGTSAAVITRSFRNIEIGTKVVIRPSR